MSKQKCGIMYNYFWTKLCCIYIMLTQYNKIQNLYINLFIQIKISKVLTGPFIENKIPELLCNYYEIIIKCVNSI